MQANGLARADAPISEERKQQIATFLGDLPEEYNERECLPMLELRALVHHQKHTAKGRNMVLSSL
jgi:hypothetical protein